LEQINVELLRCPDGEVWFRNIRIDRDTSFEFRASGSGPDCDTLYHVGTAPYDLQVPTLNILPSCPGKDDGALQITSNTSGNVILDGIDYGNNRFIRPIPTGAFELIWTDSNQCRQAFELTMLERDSLQGIIPEKVISCGEEITLQIEVQSDEDSTFQALWQNGQMGLTLSVNRPGIYLAEIRNACESKIIRGLVSDRDDGRTQLYFVPSAFTPNEDGINEGFKTYWPDEVVVEKFLLEVYDRWGQLQFRSSDPEAEWTGFRKDQQEKVAVYIWKLNASVEYCGEKREIQDSGDVTLIR
jgi:gliding motility-associated-like protein